MKVRFRGSVSVYLSEPSVSLFLARPYPVPVISAYISPCCICGAFIISLISLICIKIVVRLPYPVSALIIVCDVDSADD